MSTPAPTPGNPQAPAPGAIRPTATQEAPLKRQIGVLSHCTLFYWWPVWAVGFVMGILSLFSHQRMVVVPEKTESAKGLKVPGYEGEREVLVLPANEELTREPHLHASSNKNIGVLFCTVLLLVIVITNIPLRGLWSVIVIVLIVALSLVLALWKLWESILLYLSFLDIRINAAGYFVISSVLFALWLLIMLIFDQQIYMIFSPGQLRVRTEIGDAEMAYDTTGMTIQKQRSDLFRHWVLGLGSGDLIVRTSGANTHEFHFPNVLFVGRKVRDIEEMMREKQVVPGGRV